MLWYVILLHWKRLVTYVRADFCDEPRYGELVFLSGVEPLD